MNELSITVVIADRPYKLSIKKDEEETVRKAAKIIDEQIKVYAKNFDFRDKQDLLAMVALQFTTSSIHFEKELSYTNTNLVESLESIDKVLTDNID